MHLDKNIIIIAVLLFFGLGIALMVIMDYKGRLKSETQFGMSFIGKRFNHPVEAFFIAIILLGIIVALLGSLVVTLGGQFGLFQEEEQPELLQSLNEERVVEKMRHFHNSPEVISADSGEKNVCFYCHGDYPHSREPMIRTMMNMHTQFTGCSTCHTNPEKYDESNYRFAWLNYSGIEVKGVPFGTELNPATGQLIQTDDFHSKIVIYYNENGQEQLMELTQDNQQVQEFIQIRDQLTEKDRESVKKRFHSTIAEKGRTCSKCHTSEDKSFIPFEQLGFSQHRIAELTNLNVVGLIEKYERFYMPDLLFSNDTEKDSAKDEAGKK
ncbi:MAG: hypothetical protein OEY19_02995 [Gammaproteobacteria bacterium]|nr:hypothetical protein [Gammaproteobacteria bacterium]MDH5630167.1 hypothetical protein [Gammaproteobacteria bacterium]